MNNNIKVEMLIVTGKSVYVIGGLAIVGACAVTKQAYDGALKLKEMIGSKRSKKEDEGEQ